MIDSKTQSNEIPHFIVQSDTLCCSKLVIQSVGNEFNEFFLVCLYVYVPEDIIGLIYSTLSLYPCPPHTATLTKRQRGCLFRACFNHQGLSARHNTGPALF